MTLSLEFRQIFRSLILSFACLLILGSGLASANQDTLSQEAYSDTNTLWAEWSTNNDQALPFVDSIIGSSITFYGKSISHHEFMDTETAFAERWPIRRYVLEPSSLAITCNDQAFTCHVSGIVDWNDSSLERDARSIGTANFNFDLLIVPQGGGYKFEMISESGLVISRTTGTIEALANQSPVVAQPPTAQLSAPTAPPSSLPQASSPAINQSDQADTGGQEPVMQQTDTNAPQSSGIAEQVASVLGISITAIIVITVFLYFVPTAVSMARHGSMGTIVFLLNLFFGWTVLGWFCALLIALFSSSKEQIEIQRATLADIREQRASRNGRR